MSSSSNAMKFISPEMYARSQESHFVINSDVVNQFAEIFGTLGTSDRVLDFGSGTGETTSALAQVFILTCHSLMALKTSSKEI